MEKKKKKGSIEYLQKVLSGFLVLLNIIRYVITTKISFWVIEFCFRMLISWHFRILGYLYISSKMPNVSYRHVLEKSWLPEKEIQLQSPTEVDTQPKPLTFIWFV